MYKLTERKHSINFLKVLNMWATFNTLSISMWSKQIIASISWEFFSVMFVKAADQHFGLWEVGEMTIINLNISCASELLNRVHCQAQL